MSCGLSRVKLTRYKYYFEKITLQRLGNTVVEFGWVWPVYMFFLMYGYLMAQSKKIMMSHSEEIIFTFTNSDLYITGRAVSMIIKTMLLVQTVGCFSFVQLGSLEVVV
jgi:hypothetical protein